MARQDQRCKKVSSCGARPCPWRTWSPRKGNVEGWVEIGRFVCDPGSIPKPFHVLFLHMAQVPYCQQAIGRRISAALVYIWLSTALPATLLVEELLASGKLLVEKGKCPGDLAWSYVGAECSGKTKRDYESPHHDDTRNAPTARAMSGRGGERLLVAA